MEYIADKPANRNNYSRLNNSILILLKLEFLQANSKVHSGSDS